MFLSIGIVLLVGVSKCGSKFGVNGVHVLDMTIDGRDHTSWSGGGFGSWAIASCSIERRVLSGRVDVVVVLKSVEGKPVGPVVLLIRCEVGEVVFDHLVRSSGLTIGLKVIHSRSSRGGSEISKERRKGIGSECSAVIGDCLFGRAMVSIGFPNEEIEPGEALWNKVERGYSSWVSRRR